MKKHFFLLCYITLGLLPIQAHVPEMDSLLKRLDTVIKERPLAIEKKKSRLRELELRYSKNTARTMPIRLWPSRKSAFAWPKTSATATT